MNTSYDAKILDTGDYYILAFAKPNIIQTAIALYEQMDITVNLIDTQLVVGSEVKDFIKSICGRLISYNRSSIVIDGSHTGNIVDKLRNDLQQIVCFSNIKSFWSNYNNVPAPKAAEVLVDVDGVDKSELNYGTITEAYDSTIRCEHSDVQLDLSHVVYNTVYNISLFVDGMYNVPAMCEEFTEFELIESFQLTDSMRPICKDLFHKRTFMSKTKLREKLDSFKQLYDLQKEDDEKQKVFRFMDNMFIMNKDIAQKMGASDLYNMVMAHLCIEYMEKTAFRKRLAGYFVELGLTRKRYSDGYYYYGLKPKYEEKVIISLEEIMQRRSAEKERWTSQ